MRNNSKVPQIVELIGKGLTANEIADEVGCTRMNVFATAKRYNLKLKITDRNKFSPEAKETMRRFKRSGLTCKEIAQIYKCSPDTVKEITRGSGQAYRNQYSIDSFDSEGHARTMINNYLRERDIEYAGNYTGADDPVDLRCKKCGTVFTRSMILVRNRKVSCPNCKEKQKQEKAIQREEEQKAKIARQEEKRLKALAKIQEKKAKEHPCAVCGCITDKPKYCSRACANKVLYKNKELRRARKIKDAIVDKDISLEKLYKRDNGICYICGLKCSYEDYVMRGDAFIAGDYYPSIEHIKPLSKGGLHSWNNIKLAHRRCNTFKGAHDSIK